MGLSATQKTGFGLRVMPAAKRLEVVEVERCAASLDRCAVVDFDAAFAVAGETLQPPPIMTRTVAQVQSTRALG
jgi:hypothetical protein